MSLRFLTRRRDRDRDRSNPTSNTTDKSPASTCVVLPPSDSFLRKGKTALVPSEVQIISWHPQDLQASGREVHISSRAQSTPASSSATPVYHAFTARPSSSNLSSSKRVSNNDTNDSAHTSGSDIGQTFFSARDPPTSHRSYDCKTSNRARPKTAPRAQPSSWADSKFSESTSATPQAPSASDTPRSEDVEELSSSLGALPPLDQQEPAKQSLPIRFASKGRHAKSRSHHGHASTYSAYDDSVNTPELPTSSFTGTPSSLPSTSGLAFSPLHRNASVPSLANFFHFGGAKEASADQDEAGPSISTSSGLLSRVASTRQLRKSKNATAAADVDQSASANSGQFESNNDHRPRTHSIGSITSKLRRSKDHTQGSATPSKGAKSSRGAAPPSAWRTDSSAATATADVSSSAYSSDNEPSVGPGSSSGHGVESGGGGTASYQRHAKNASLGDVITSTTTAHHHSPLPSSSQFASSDMPSYKRISSYSTRSTTSQAAVATSQPHPDRTDSTLDSPQVSGLPLPLPVHIQASPGGTIFTAQLLKRIGPPPVGLASDCFEDRVVLIKNYILDQLPLPLTPRSQSPEDNFPGVPHFKSRSDGFSSHHVHRSSLPPPSRHGSTRNSSITSSAGASHLTTLQDEFDKLECLAEQELSKLAGPLSQQQQHKASNAVDVVSLLQDLRLEEAFLEARRRCGVDCSKSHFELKSFAARADTRLLSDAGRGGMAGNGGGALGLGLRGMGPQDEGVKVGSAEMSLRPAPRRKRGVGVAAGAGAGRATRRPITAPATGSGQTLHSPLMGGDGTGKAVASPAVTAALTPLDYETPFVAHSGIGFDGELFTPQSFSSKTSATRPTTSTRTSPFTTRPPSSNDTHSTNSSGSHGSHASHASHTTHRSTVSSSSSAAIRSPPLFGHDLTRAVFAFDRVMEGKEGETGGVGEEGKGERHSQDTQLTDSDCCVAEEAAMGEAGRGMEKGKRRMVEW